MVLRIPSTVVDNSNDASQTEAMQTPASVSSIPGGSLQNQNANIKGHSIVPNTLEEWQYSEAIPFTKLDRASLNIEESGNLEKQVEMSLLNPLEFTILV